MLGCSMDKLVISSKPTIRPDRRQNNDQQRNNSMDMGLNPWTWPSRLADTSTFLPDSSRRHQCSAVILTTSQCTMYSLPANKMILLFCCCCCFFPAYASSRYLLYRTPPRGTVTKAVGIAVIPRLQFGWLRFATAEGYLRLFCHQLMIFNYHDLSKTCNTGGRVECEGWETEGNRMFEQVRSDT